MTTEQHAKNLKEMKHAIIADINNGTIPKSVSSFAELHNYVDANEYLAFAFPEFNATCDMKELDVYSDELDAWIKSKHRYIRTPESRVLGKHFRQ
jgi:hypothetical protein